MQNEKSEVQVKKRGICRCDALRAQNTTPGTSKVPVPGVIAARSEKFAVGLRELRYGCVGPLRADAGHVERGEHALGFAQVVPTHAGDSDHRETIRALG